MPRSVLVSLALRAAAVCSSDEDCQLSGICSAGMCQCDPMWKGDDCSELNFLAPDDVQPAYPPPEIVNETTSWGGSVFQDPETGLFHMFVAEMAHGCGMATWSTNSQIAYATSATAEGPYTRKATVAVPFAHNPTTARAPDGTWVLFQIGCGAQQAVGPCSSCKGGVTTGSCSLPFETVSCDPSPFPANPPKTAHVFHASAPEGPWEAADIKLENVGKPPSMGKFGLDNPAPYFFPNGSLLILARCEIGSVGDVRADSWKGPYRMGRDIGDAGGLGGVEDPYLYRDSRGAFHALFHTGRQGRKACGGHAFSANGVNWTYSKTPAYTTDILTKSGSLVAFNRRERPHLILGRDGQPTHLVTALTNHIGGHRGNDKAFTYIHALNTKREIAV